MADQTEEAVLAFAGILKIGEWLLKMLLMALACAWLWNHLHG